MPTQHAEPLYLLVHLAVVPGEERTFRAYERRALAILRKHGGELLQALRPETEPDRVHEVHLIRLPSHSALEAYRHDPALAALREMRGVAVASTSITLAGDVTDLYTLPAVTIRPAVPADAAAIAYVHVASWRSTYRGIVPDSYLDRLDPAERVEARERTLASPAEGSVMLVAEVEGAGVVGFAQGGRGRGEPETTGEIYAIYLLEEWEGRGIGNRLMREAVRQLAANGMDRLVVWVLSENRSRGFYEHLGGMARREKALEIGGATLNAVAYEWDDIGTVTG